MRVLGIIPARGGSKGVPNKNRRLLAGKPLIQYSIESARACAAINDLVTTSDCPAILSLAESLGCPALPRPAELADDAAPMLPVVQHALRARGPRGPFDAVCLLQPTNPFRRPEEISACVTLLSRHQEATAVVSVREIPKTFHPSWAFVKDADGYAVRAVDAPLPTGRQALPEAYFRDGTIYLTRAEVVLAGSLYGDRLLPWVASSQPYVNIDTMEDWAAAEQAIGAQNNAICESA